MPLINTITQNSTRGTGSAVVTTQTVTHAKTEGTSEGARVSTDATAAATGSRVSAVTGNDDAGFTISFSVPLLGGLNASGDDPPLDP